LSSFILSLILILIHLVCMVIFANYTFACGSICAVCVICSFTCLLSSLSLSLFVTLALTSLECSFHLTIFLF
jgi:hypothetical protein